MRYGPFLHIFCALAASISVGAAQAPNLSDAAKALVGTWEFTNADRDKVCTVTFRTDRSTSGMKVDFDRTCANVFPFIREVAGWTMGENDFLRLVNAQGRSVLDFSEVESGVYEAPRPGEGILFIQNAGAAGPAPRTAEQIAGDWQVVRGSTQPICTLTLVNTAAGADLALRVTPPCDGLVTRFAPTTWQVDRGELLLKSARGQTWRFEESGETTWRRVPEAADPITLVRK
jgi:hypothetical protein